MKRFAWIAVAGVALLSACGGLRSPDFVAKLQGVQISPAVSTVDLGGTVKFDVKGMYSAPPGSATTSTIGDVSGVSFAVDKADTASIDNAGNLRGLKRGAVKVTATAKGFSATATVNITGFVLTAITITPADPVTVAAGLTQPYTTQGTYTDETGATKSGDINETVSWSSSATSVATVAPPQGAGTTATTRAPGGTSTAITASATNFEGAPISKTVTLMVGVPLLQDLVITPVPASTPPPFRLPVGGSQTFAVQGIYSDSATPRMASSTINPVTWSSNTPAVASFNQVMSNTQNVLTANALDPSNTPVVLTVSAPDGTGKTITSSQSVQVTVTNAVLQNITQIVAVDGTNPLRVGNAAVLPLLARGMFTDGTTVDLANNLVVWSVVNGTGQATITNFSSAPAVNGGELKGVAIGAVTVTATANSATNTKSISAVATVTDPVCVVPYVTPDTGVGASDAACLSDLLPIGGTTCGVRDGGNTVTASQTDFATMTLGIGLTASNNTVTVNSAVARATTEGQQAGFIIAFTGTDFDPQANMTIAAGSNGPLAPNVSNLGTTTDGLNRRLVTIPVTGSFSNLTATVVVPGLAGLTGLANPTGLLSLLARGGTTDVRFYTGCSTAVAPAGP